MYAPWAHLRKGTLRPHCYYCHCCSLFFVLVHTHTCTRCKTFINLSVLTFSNGIGGCVPLLLKCCLFPHYPLHQLPQLFPWLFMSRLGGCVCVFVVFFLWAPRPNSLSVDLALWGWQRYNFPLQSLGLNAAVDDGVLILLCLDELEGSMQTVGFLECAAPVCHCGPQVWLLFGTVAPVCSPEQKPLYPSVPVAVSVTGLQWWLSGCDGCCTGYLRASEFRPRSSK